MYNYSHGIYLYDICTMLDQRRRRWDDVIQMLYKCFVFARLFIYFVLNTTHSLDKK